MVSSSLPGLVNSIDRLGSASLQPIGFAVAWFAADRIGSSPVFVLGGEISSDVIGLESLHPAVRGLD